MKLLKISMFSMIMSLMMVSCTEKKSDVEASMIRVNLDDALPLKEAASSINVLMLNDSLSNHFPGNINKVEWMGDSILILDSWKDPGLYMYDSEGVLVNSYTKRGNGPDEFVGIVDFNVVPSGVVLLDTYSTSQRRQAGLCGRRQQESGLAGSFRSGKRDVCQLQCVCRCIE